MIADMSLLHLTQEKRPAVEMVAALMVTRAIGRVGFPNRVKLHDTKPEIMYRRQRIRRSFAFLPIPWKGTPLGRPVVFVPVSGAQSRSVSAGAY